MREIRYRIVAPHGGPVFVPEWFQADGVTHVHGTRIEFHEEETSCRLVAFADDPEIVAAAMHARPFRTATRWDIRASGPDMVLGEVAWREPAFGSSPTLARVAHDALAGRARCAFTLRRSHMVNRILAADDLPLESLLGKLVQALDGAAQLLGVGLRIQLDRIARLPLRADPHDADFLEVIMSAFELGAFDRPPAASPAQVARALGVPEKTVETYLHEARSAAARSDE